MLASTSTARKQKVYKSQQRQKPGVDLGADDDDDDEEEDDPEADEEEEGPMGGWGANKRAYYNTNDLDNLDSREDMCGEEPDYGLGRLLLFLTQVLRCSSFHRIMETLFRRPA